MMPDLFWMTLITAVLLLGLGGAFVFGGDRWRDGVLAFPRSEKAAFVTMGLGGAWFVYKMWFLGPEDALFGPKTNLVFTLVFGGAWIGSFFVLKDFLSVRGASVLILMAAFFALKAGLTHYEAGALFFKVVVYVLIVAAIWLGVSPYHLRDFFGWLYRSATRPRALGGSLAGVGLILVLVALTYPAAS